MNPSATSSGGRIEDGPDRRTSSPGASAGAAERARLGSAAISGKTGKVRVAVVFGGRSAEHAISCVSAGSGIAALDPDRYDVVRVGIATDGRWVLADPGQRLAITEGKLPEVTGGTAVSL